MWKWISRCGVCEDCPVRERGFHEAACTEDLLNRLGALGDGRVIFRREAISVVKRFRAGRFLADGEELLSDGEAGLSLAPGTLRALVHARAGAVVPTISFLDREGVLRLMVDFPKLDFGSDRMRAWLAAARCERLEGSGCPAGIGCVAWEDLTPEGGGYGGIDPEMLARIVGCGSLEIRAGDGCTAIATELKPALIDSDGQVVRLSDRPRTQVCYAHLGKVRLDDRSGGRMALSWAA